MKVTIETHGTTYTVEMDDEIKAPDFVENTQPIMKAVWGDRVFLEIEKEVE